MTIDPISDMATIIRNAIAIKNSLVTLPYTKNNEIIAEILAKEGFIHCVTTTNKINFSISSSTNFNRNGAEKSFQNNSIPKNDLSVETSMTHNTNLSGPDFPPEHLKENAEENVSSQNVEKESNLNTKKQTNSGAPIKDQDPKSFLNEKSSGPRSKIRAQKGTTNQKVIILALKYVGREKKAMIHAIKRVSKPSLKWYSQNPIPQSLGGLGIFVVSTSFGIITDKEAREKKLGGEILLEIW